MVWFGRGVCLYASVTIFFHKCFLSKLMALFMICYFCVWWLRREKWSADKSKKVLLEGSWHLFPVNMMESFQKISAMLSDARAEILICCSLCLDYGVHPSYQVVFLVFLGASPCSLDLLSPLPQNICIQARIWVVKYIGRDTIYYSIYYLYIGRDTVQS